MDTIILTGQFLDHSGYAWASRCYYKMFASRFSSEYNLMYIDASVEKDIEDAEVQEWKDYFEIPDINFCTAEDLSSLEGKVYSFECILPSMRIGKDGQVSPMLTTLRENENIELKKISLMAWETNKLPDIFLECLKVDYDFLILHTKCHYDSIKEDLKIPSAVLHYPMLEYYNPSDRESTSWLRDDGKFRILSSSAFTDRKGWGELINAFYSEFHGDEDVELMIKTHGDTDYIVKILQKFKLQSSAQITDPESTNVPKKLIKLEPKCKVLLNNSEMSEKQIKKMYAESDVYASATRGEGFGLTIAKAALSGLPLIVPNCGGHLDFCSDYSYRVKCYTSPIHNMPWYWYTNRDMYLYTVDHNSLKRTLRQAYEDWKTTKLERMGALGREYAEKALSTDTAEKGIRNIMRRLDE